MSDAWGPPDPISMYSYCLTFPRNNRFLKCSYSILHICNICCLAQLFKVLMQTSRTLPYVFNFSHSSSTVGTAYSVSRFRALGVLVVSKLGI